MPLPAEQIAAFAEEFRKLAFTFKMPSGALTRHPASVAAGKVLKSPQTTLAGVTPPIQRAVNATSQATAIPPPNIFR